MLDHILGRPSLSWKRTQVFLVIFFWAWRISNGPPNGPGVLYIRRLNRFLQRYTPWQVIVSTLTILYGARHIDSIIGLGSPEPLARLYSRSYYRATWFATGFDAGFATAMNIQPKWLRDICSMLFTLYYIIYANEADEKLRKFRAVCTVEYLRVTWEKNANPYIRILSFWDRPSLPVVRQILIPRPPNSKHRKPILAWLYWSRSEEELSTATDLILDVPGGGFVAMPPPQHEERLRRWAKTSNRPVLAIDYGKAPEYPYPWAMEEVFDVYQVLVASQGTAIGMSGKAFNVIMAGDSAGANIACGVMFKILENPRPIQKPVALVFNYPCLDFNFGSWMTPANLRVLKAEASSANLPGVQEQKDHFSHRSPLAVVPDVSQRRLKRRQSWGNRLSGLASRLSSGSLYEDAQATPTGSRSSLRRNKTHKEDQNSVYGGDEADDEYYPLEEHEKPLFERFRYTAESLREKQPELEVVVEEENTKALLANKERKGTRLTMTSRTGYFQDRIISPSMMRAMAILYLGLADPDFETDYYVSPILAPSSLLAQFPPLLITCGEKDPFVDDSVIFAGRIREAKLALRADLERGKSGKYGEHLRMSSGVESVRARLLQESEEDWVQMEIFEGWSHGYLQMTSLMGEAAEVINKIGEWIDGAFLRFGCRIVPTQEHTTSPLMNATETSPAAASPRRPSTSKRQRPDMESAVALASGTETEGEGKLTMVSKKRRSPPPSFGSGTTSLSGATLRPQGSSEETLVGRSPTPNKLGASVASKVLDEAELMRRRRAEAVEGM